VARANLDLYSLDRGILSRAQNNQIIQRQQGLVNSSGIPKSQTFFVRPSFSVFATGGNQSTSTSAPQTFTSNFTNQATSQPTTFTTTTTTTTTTTGGTQGLTSGFDSAFTSTLESTTTTTTRASGGGGVNDFNAYGDSREEPNRLVIPSILGSAFAKVVWFGLETSVPTAPEQVSDLFWRVPVSLIGQEQYWSQMSVIYITSQDICFEYAGELRQVLSELVPFVQGGGLLVVNSEWGISSPEGGVGCARNVQQLDNDVNNIFSTNMRDQNDFATDGLGGNFGGSTFSVEPQSNFSPYFRTQHLAASTFFSGGVPIFKSPVGEAVVVYQNFGLGYVVRVGDSNLSGGYPEFVIPGEGGGLSSFAVGLLAFAADAPYEAVIESFTPLTGVTPS
jgi:hypothetical protein